MAEDGIKESFEVDETAAGMRLDHFLARQFPHVSRFVLRQAIANGFVLVNNHKLRLSYKLWAGDLVQVGIAPAPNPAFIPEPIPIQVVFEDDHMVVVDKPAGLLVHPNKTTTSGTLMNALCYHLQSSESGARPGLVHRLDRDTSGLLVVAKTEQAHRVLAKHFRKRMVVKRYLALVHGQVEEGSFDVNLPIGWVADVYPHWQVTERGRDALTRVCVVERFRDCTLLEVEPETGRTHQIRIHLAAVGHPLVGESLYDRHLQQFSRHLRERTGITLQRHFLHAVALQFNHPRSGEPLRFCSPLPNELQALIEKVRAMKPFEEPIEPTGGEELSERSKAQ